MTYGACVMTLEFYSFGCTRLNLELNIFYALATASIFSILSVIFFFHNVFLYTLQ